MRSDKIMNLREVNTAAINMELIESSLGHSIPAGVVDATELSDHILNAVEIAKISTNIRLIENSRNHKPSKLSVSWGLFCLGGAALYLIVGIFYLLFS